MMAPPMQPLTQPLMKRRALSGAVPAARRVSRRKDRLETPLAMVASVLTRPPPVMPMPSRRVARPPLPRAAGLCRWRAGERAAAPARRSVSRPAPPKRRVSRHRARWSGARTGWAWRVWQG
ncbi:hypothetical protein [Acidibrevibacterium fodinaquatile]|uniref:hypothetical protein n=1 Tax=Acidibrevibacterium fodinaquatile TaxID=1969806 RepID=UPI0013B3934C|nr:hypothetical protein [Acidibrevibacterium fodinaquatile]